MAFSYYTYTGDGSATQFPVAFGYIRREHVFATVAGAPATFTFVNNTTIQMTTAPANGAAVRVYRQTPLTAPLVDFADGATLVAADLDTNALQSIYTQQELDDSLVDGLAGVIPNGDKGDITTSVNGSVWTIDAGAVVEAKIGAGAVTEAKIGAAAVTEAKIGTGAVSAAKIAAAAFTDSTSSTSTTTIATPNSVKTSYDLATTANATANAALPKAGGTMTGVITFASAQPRLVRGTAQASTSGTAINFHDIPSWVNRLTMMLNGVSTNGSEIVFVQLGTGTSGSPIWVTSGYDSNANTSGSSLGVFSSVGFLLETGGSSSFLRSGLVQMCRIDGNVWVYNSNIKQAIVTGTTGNDIGAGNSGDLGGVLTQVRLTTTSAVDTFDAGTVNIMYEG